MTPLVVSAGTEVCRQGENGDAFYVIQSGRMEVLAKELEETPILKALLGPGMTFGEEALLTGKPRSATVKAVEESLLLCLNQKTLRSFLEADFAREVSINEALQMQKEAGNVLLDVRFPEEAEDGQVPKSQLLPLGELRVRYRELDPKTRYLVYCRSGRRSKIAAFLLNQRGYKALSVAGGMLAWQQAVERWKSVIERFRASKVRAGANRCLALPTLKVSARRQKYVAWLLVRRHIKGKLITIKSSTKHQRIRV